MGIQKKLKSSMSDIRFKQGKKGTSKVLKLIRSFWGPENEKKSCEILLHFLRNGSFAETDLHHTTHKWESKKN